MWSEPAPRWELFEGRTREPEPGSRTDAIIALTFLLIVVAVALTALGWWLVRTDALRPCSMPCNVRRGHGRRVSAQPGRGRSVGTMTLCA